MVSGGPLVPGYEDLEVLGRGGFATVYRARQVAFDRLVALKVLDGADTDERTVQLFTRECRAAGSLSWHPHVVVVFDAGTTDRGTPYLAMELLPGGSLADRLAATGPLPVDEAVRLTGEVASALAAAHEADLLHRDVKPANVLVDRLGRAKLADFGIARLVGAGSATATGAVTGTVAYMAPEVLKGAKASPASDVYALGLTLLTLIAGRNPLTADSDDSPFVVIARVIAGEPLEIPAGVPPEVRGLVEVCTDHDPAARPTAADVAARCAGLVPPPPGPPTPPPPPPPSAPSPPPPPPGSGAIPPPPSSAVRVRDDHTLAEPPPPGPPVDRPTTVVDQGASPEGVAGAAPEPPRRSRGILVGVVGALVALVLIGAAVVWLAGGDDDPTVATGGDDGATSVSGEEGGGAGDGACPGTPITVTDEVDLRAIAAAGSDVWVVDFDGGTLTRVDAATDEVAATISLPPPGPDAAPPIEPDDAAAVDDTYALTAVDGAVWVPRARSRTVLRVDRATDAVVATISLDLVPTSVAVGAEAVWVAGAFDDALARVDLETGSVTDTVALDVGDGLGYFPPGIVAADGAVWVVGDDVVSKLDEATGEVLASSELPDDAAPDQIAVGAGSVWLADGTGSRVLRLDPDSAEVTSTIEVDENPRSVAVDGDVVWVMADVADEVVTIDPETEEVTVVAEGLGTWIAASGGGAWTISHAIAGVCRVAAPSEPGDPTEGGGSTTTAVPGEDRAIGVTPERTAALLVAEEVDGGREASDDDLDDATLESMRVDQFCSIAPAEALLARRFVDPADEEGIDVVQTLIVFPDAAAAEAYLAEDFCVGPSADPVPGLGDEATSYLYGDYEQLTIRVGAVVTEIVGAAAEDLRSDVAPTAAAKLAQL